MPMDALYWNSISFGSEESLPTRTPPRDYIDPWDLENYAYIREQLNLTEQSSEANSSSEYPVDSNFYYVSPGVLQDKRKVSIPASANYVAIDDDDETQDEVPISRVKIKGKYQSGIQNEPYKSNVRKSSMACPSGYRDRSMSFSYGDHSLYEMGGNRDEESYLKSNSDVPLYDYIRAPNKPRNFGLSKYGHLQIDYSCSWINLDKYIYN